jgi:hypothetical protein
MVKVTVLAVVFTLEEMSVSWNITVPSVIDPVRRVTTTVIGPPTKSEEICTQWFSRVSPVFDPSIRFQ